MIVVVDKVIAITIGDELIHYVYHDNDLTFEQIIDDLKLMLIDTFDIGHLDNKSLGG